jgi:hypothetical protein
LYLSEEELRERLYNHIIIFLNRFPYCRCFGVKAGYKVHIFREIWKGKLTGKRYPKYYIRLGEKFGVYPSKVASHYSRHALRQVVAVEELLDKIMDEIKAYEKAEKGNS